LEKKLYQIKGDLLNDYLRPALAAPRIHTFLLE